MKKEKLSVKRQNFKYDKIMSYELKLLMNIYVYLLHDYLLTPVTHIIGFSHLLEDKKISNNPRLRKEYLAIISRESDRLYRNIEKIVDFLQHWDMKTVKTLDVRDIVMSVEKETLQYLKKHYQNI
jgi:K+-sensing histidine kinase KdpD